MLRGLELFDLERVNIEKGQAWTRENVGSGEVARLCNDYPNAGRYVINLRLSPKEQLRWMEAALSAARQLGDRQNEGAHLGNIGVAYADLGEMQKAIKFYEQALTIAHETGDKRTEEAVVSNVGLAYASLGETRKAIEYYERSLTIAREIGDRREEGNALGNLGNAYLDLGETHKAIGYHEQYLKIAREIGDGRGESNALSNTGFAYFTLGEPRKAIEFYDQGLKIAREIGDRRREGATLGNLGLAYANLGEMRKAIEYYEQRLTIAREIGERRGEGNALWNMSLALDQLGQQTKAIEHAEVALKIFEALEDPNARKVSKQSAVWLSNLGNTNAALGETRKAIEYYERSLAVARKIGDLGDTSNHFFSVGLIFIDQGRWYDALHLFEECLEIRRKGDDLNVRADALYQIAHVHHLLRNLEKARTYYWDAKRLYEKTNNPKGIASCNLSLGRLMIQMGFVDDAVQELTVAGEIYHRLDDQSRIDTTDEMMRLAKGIKEKQLA